MEQVVRNLFCSFAGNAKFDLLFREQQTKYYVLLCRHLRFKTGRLAYNINMFAFTASSVSFNYCIDSLSHPNMTQCSIMEGYECFGAIPYVVFTSRL